MPTKNKVLFNANKGVAAIKFVFVKKKKKNPPQWNAQDTQRNACSMQQWLRCAVISPVVGRVDNVALARLPLTALRFLHNLLVGAAFGKRSRTQHVDQVGGDQHLVGQQLETESFQQRLLGQQQCVRAPIGAVDQCANLVVDQARCGFGVWPLGNCAYGGSVHAPVPHAPVPQHCPLTGIVAIRLLVGHHAHARRHAQRGHLRVRLLGDAVQVVGGAR